MVARWFNAYFSDRFHCMSVQGSMLDLSVKSGVSQGSVLGLRPFILLIYNLLIIMYRATL